MTHRSLMFVKGPKVNDMQYCHNTYIQSVTHGNLAFKHP